MDTDNKVLHEDLTEDIIGAAFDVHNALGCGLLEKVCENALAHELALRKHAATGIGHRAAPSCLGLRAASSCRFLEKAGERSRTPKRYAQQGGAHDENG